MDSLLTLLLPCMCCLNNENVSRDSLESDRCSVYSVPNRSDFISLHLSAEAANARLRGIEFLQTIASHLTLSFDGWSSQKHDEIYTVHVTTPLRRSFLIDGLVLTGLSVTGELLSEKLDMVRYQARIVCS